MKLDSKRHCNQLKIAFDLLKESDGKRILDLGCGNGILEQYFVDHQVIGVDISEAAINKAKQNAPWANYILADIRNLPLEDKCVDKVAMLGVLGGLPMGDEVIVFKEAKRVLTEGGRLIILVSQKRQPYSLLTPGRLYHGSKWRHFNIQILQKQLIENGFTINKVIFVGGFLSLGFSLLNFYWNAAWRFLTKRVIGRIFVPSLPHRFLNKIESLEFRPFMSKLQSFARYSFVVARKT
jgi:SAM-dependent methyltransferase